MTGREEKVRTDQRILRSGRRKLRRTVYLLPTVFTVGNIFAGFYSVTATLDAEFQKAAVAIAIALVLDFMDGWVARSANMTTDFGSQLDSLADVISFGLAPALLMYSWGLSDLGRFGSFTVFFFLMCGATRLARFNVQLKDLKHFAGLPIPAGAGFIAATVHLFGEPPGGHVFSYYLVGITYLNAFLMISTVRYPSFKNLRLTGGKSHLNVLVLGLLMAGIVWYSRPVLMAMATAYLSSGLLSRVHQFVRYRLQREEVRGGELKVD